MGSDLLLAVETSCDETAAALVDAEGEVLVSHVASQVELHAPYGGVVPELASRTHNTDLRPLIGRVLEDAGVDWDRIGGVAATSGPGLSSSLLIGDTTAKAVAAALGRPFYSINHMEGHVLSPFIGAGTTMERHLALVVSGGHTLLVEVGGVGDYRVVGTTRDDAAGEAFDKVGKMLGLPYPGGPEIAKRAEIGRRDVFDFPRSMIGSGDGHFSFSGLKTAVRYLLDKLDPSPPPEVIADVCASFQEAVVDVLVAKLFQAAEASGVDLVTVSGGVSCNRRLRERVSEAAACREMRLLLAEPRYSTDNAAMIAFAAAMRRRAGMAGSPLEADIDPNLALG